jgi:hypothetical protein
VTRLEYKLARMKAHRFGDQFLASGERYPTREAARLAAPMVNAERESKGLEPCTHILTLPAKDTEGIDPSHFLSAEPL